MGERKVLNKYIPADFDPSLVPKGKKLSQKDGTVPVRMMLPFSVQCTTCNTFLYRGRKFNSKKEPMGGPQGRYLGIQRWRFYIKCTHCSRAITFCTDPQNADYEMESGGTRNYEVYKDQSKKEEEAAQDQEEEEKVDHMKALENRVLDSQREMADLDNLEEIKAMNRRHVNLLSAKVGEEFDEGVKSLLDKIDAKKKGNDGEGLDSAIELTDELTEEDEALIKSIQFGKPAAEQQHLLIVRDGNGKATKKKQAKSIKRLDEEDERRLEEQRQQEIAKMEQRQREIDQKAKEKKAAFPVVKVKRRRPTAAANQAKKEMPKKQKVTTSNPNSANSGAVGLASLLGGYGSSSESD